MRGPFLPLYGSGAIMMLVVSMPFQDNLVMVYIAGCIGATVLDLPDRAKVLDLHYPVRSRHLFAGKYPAAGIHTSVSRLVYSGIGFQPYL